MRALAGTYRRVGPKMLHRMVRRKGWVVNHKRSERIYRRKGLQVLKRRGRKQPTVPRMKMPAPTRPYEVLAMDIMKTGLPMAGR
jgi:putative transposase